MRAFSIDFVLDLNFFDMVCCIVLNLRIIPLPHCLVVPLSYCLIVTFFSLAYWPIKQLAYYTATPSVFLFWYSVCSGETVQLSFG